MSSRYGGKIITDGLVLCLDAHDAKSYAGEPITNMAYNIGITGHGSTWEAITNVPGSEGQTGPGAHVNFKKLHDDSVANTFSSANGKIFRNYVNNPATSNSTSFNNNGGFRYTSSINLTSGGASGYVIISFWCYLVTGYQGYVSNGLGSAYMQFSDSGGTYTGNGSKSFYVDGVSKTSNETFNGDTGRWKFVQIRFTKPANSTAIRNFYIYADRNTQGEMYICQLQIEDRSDSTFYQVPFVEGASSRSAIDGWKDRTANSYDGTLVSMAGTGADHYRAGQVIMPLSNSYLEFDGTDDYIDLGTTAGNFGTDPFTVSVWLNFDALGSFYNKYAADQDQILFSHSGGKPYFIYNAPNGTDYGYTVSNTTISTGTWYNFVATVDRSSNFPVIYVNGVNDGSSLQSSAGSPTTANMDNNGNLRIGRGLYSGSYSYFNGKMAQLLVYKGKALTAAEVLSNYNTTKSRFS